MSGVTCRQQVVVLSGEDRLHGCSFDEDLASGETLSGTPTVTDYNSTGDLTISSVAVNTATFTGPDKETVAIGKGVQFRVSGATIQREYTLKVLCGTTDSNTVGALCKYIKEA